jgi:rubrerythrin
MAKIYFCYFEEFKQYEQLAEIWRKTAQEEENHALQFRMALNVRTGLVESTPVDLFRVANVLNALKALLKRIRESPPTPLEALRSAINLERQLADFHLDCLASFKSDSHKKMFQAMMQADKDHLEVLEKEYLLLFDAARECRRSVQAG